MEEERSESFKKAQTCGSFPSTPSSARLWGLHPRHIDRGNLKGQSVISSSYSEERRGRLKGFPPTSHCGLRPPSGCSHTSFPTKPGNPENSQGQLTFFNSSFTTSSYNPCFFLVTWRVTPGWTLEDGTSSLSGWSSYGFPRAAVSKDHKPGGLRQ